MKACRYRDGLSHVTAIGKDLEAFDAHQKARWHLQRGLCLWLSRDDVKEAASLFQKAADLYPDDERIAAARIQGFILDEDIDAALEAGRLAVNRFPVSQQIWLTYINARMTNGQVVSLVDVPSHMREEPDVLHMFAVAARRQGDFAEALHLSEKAAAYPEAGFFIRMTTLQFIIEDIARNPVAAMYGLVPKNRLEALDRVTTLFEPRHERLWSVQSSAMEEAAACIGFAFLLRKDPKSALKLTQEAATREINSKELLRISIQALSELERGEEALELGQARLADLTCESIVVVAELAAKRGDIKFLGEAVARAKGWSSECPATLDILSVFRWTALARGGEKDCVIKEIADAKIAANENLILICGAARVLSTVDRPLEAAELIDKAKLLVNADSSESDRFMLAELLFKAERWMEAAVLYEPLTTAGQISDLHIRLLTCYVKAGSRKKAKEFLNQLPHDWVENDEIRALAMNLGQNVRDWAFLLPLANTQICKAPAEAISWLFKIHIVRHVETPAAFQDVVRQIPEGLSGSIRNLAQLAGLELRYDEVSRGLRRLYHIVRSNFDEPEALSAYFISVMAAPSNLPLMDDNLSTVIAGSSVILMDNVGHELHVVIDPSDIGPLPKRTGFFEPDSPEAVLLIGAAIGETVDVPEKAFGGTQKYTVKSVQSAYRWLLQVVTERAKSFGGLPSLKAVPVGTSGDVVKDLAHMHEEVKRSTEIIRQIIEAYGAGHFTLSGLAVMLGRSPVDVVSGWPSNAPPIFVGMGLAQERDDALAALARTNASYVTDSLTLTELVNLGAPEALAALPKIYISPVTMATLEENLCNAEEDKSAGTAIDIDGQLCFIKFDEKVREGRIAFATELVNAAKKYCTVQPAYGELTAPAEVPHFVDKLQDEERELLLLAQDCNATLLTLDGRLRLIAKVGAELNGVWPQALLMHCLRTGQISSSKVSEFNVKQFLTNRRFVSIGPRDLIWMVMQGSYIQQGIQAVKRHLENPETEVESAITVALKFLKALSQVNLQLGAFGELLGHIVEPILRRKDCPPGFYSTIDEFVYNLPREEARIAHLYPPVNWMQERRVSLHRNYLAERLAEVSERANSPIKTRPIAVRILYCTKVPYLILDKSISKVASNETVQVGSNQTPSENLESLSQTSAVNSFGLCTK
ncbi:hypothetical protein SAMN05216420_10657 [Nitrosospira sp. Nl5]|uniref:tetratricopeptide repeat protein n=1 Tax=Nitrosospira sp. Nl5 TaxID=200120 RepID=UPI0008923CE4|nr:hypothetical protein [Nitrosospira sp. Nl5]SCY42908.1 hypothetical protein SAMN05216420_10657 [Nitrosospira sp. Nl5]